MNESAKLRNKKKNKKGKRIIFKKCKKIRYEKESLCTIHLKHSRKNKKIRNESNSNAITR